MDSMTFLGMFVSNVILLGGFYFTVKKNTTDTINRQNDVVNKQSETNKSLEIALTKLTSTIDNLNIEHTSLRSRVGQHGQEIDNLRLQNEGHEVRISQLEKHCDERK